jgi:hypothetical protein
MITKKFIIKFVFFITVIFFINSCKEEDAQLTAYGDVLIKSVRSGNSFKYGVYYYIYSWNKMTKASVYREEEGTKILLDSVNGRYTYVHVPDSSEFKTTKPSGANYIFNVVFDDGEQYESSDILDTTSLLPPVFKECYFDSEDERLIIDWDNDALADQYIVVLENQNNEIVFQSADLSANETYLWISSSSYGWSTNKQPEGGEIYKVIISDYQYEAVPSAFDLQSVSVAESDFLEWKVNIN